MTGGAFDACTLADAVLFAAGLGSAVVDVTVAEAAMLDALGVAQSTWPTVRANVAVAPTASDGRVQTTGPLPPGAGVAHDQPAGAASDWNTVRDGTAVVSLTLAAG